ncbi:MAG: cupin domain-containing protein, partial [Clostridia bacterium]|nr:cupin domain-containing protein [Clostridia bacterium]
TDNFELYYILEGTATVDDNGTTVDVGPGDMIYTADGAKHSITANSPMKMIATVVYENKAE